MRFALLTNQTRAARRPPLYIKPVRAEELACLFPGMKKDLSTARQAGKPRPGSAAPAAQLRKSSLSSAVETPIDVIRGSGRTPSAPRIYRNGFQSASTQDVASLSAPPVVKTGKSPAPRVGPIQMAKSPADRSEPEACPPVAPITRNPVSKPLAGTDNPQPAGQPAEAAQPPAQSFSVPTLEKSPRFDALRATRSALSLHRLMEQHPELPAQSVLLGACDDGRPLMLDLFDPEPGALLALGDDRESQLELLRNVIDSSASRNLPRRLQFLVISHQPQVWQSWVSERGFDRHCLGIAGAEEQSVSAWVLRLADWTERRRLGKMSGPPILLVLDTLSFVSRLPNGVSQNFDWMVKEGPPAQIWTLAAISTELASSLGERVMRVFRCHILGQSKDPRAYIQLTGLNEQDAAGFNEPRRFAVHLGSRLIPFRLPA